jgi:hypothetical protein
VQVGDRVTPVAGVGEFCADLPQRLDVAGKVTGRGTSAGDPDAVLARVAGNPVPERALSPAR